MLDARQFYFLKIAVGIFERNIGVERKIYFQETSNIKSYYLPKRNKTIRTRFFFVIGTLNTYIFTNNVHITVAINIFIQERIEEMDGLPEEINNQRVV